MECCGKWELCNEWGFIYCVVTDGSHKAFDLPSEIFTNKIIYDQLLLFGTCPSMHIYVV